MNETEAVWGNGIWKPLVKPENYPIRTLLIGDDGKPKGKIELIWTKNKNLIETPSDPKSLVNPTIGKVEQIWKTNPAFLSNLNLPDGYSSTTTVLSALPGTTEAEKHGTDVLPSSFGGRGLISVKSALKAESNLNYKWTGKPSAFLDPKTMPKTQAGTVYRRDEDTYGKMLKNGHSRFGYYGINDNAFKFSQRWFGGGNITRKGNIPSYTYKLFTHTVNGLVCCYESNNFNKTIVGLTDSNIGYVFGESNDSKSPGYKYGDTIGIDASNGYKNSDILLQYSDYADKNQGFFTKQTDPIAVANYNASLTKIITNLRKASSGIYKVDVTNAESRVIGSGRATKNGYDRLFATGEKNKTLWNVPLGVLDDYKDTALVDKTLVGHSQRSKRLPATGQVDGINVLNVLDSSRDTSKNRFADRPMWEPYHDDMIAFFFYDVVNDKYIPFRATIKGLTETGNASWEELQFIGRGDKVYSYGGFNRTANINFSIVIGSIAELGPTWQRINYLTTLIKPANYTSDRLSLNGNEVINRFMIPPMVMLTVGDFYKNHPILIQSIGTTIPDDASWETQNEFNSTSNGWEYLANNMRADSSINYGQMPREIEIALSFIILEKERAVVGGANFGNAPRQDMMRFEDGKNAPNRWHSNLVVGVVNSDPTNNNNVVTTTAAANSVMPPAAIAIPTTNQGLSGGMMSPLPQRGFAISPPPSVQVPITPMNTNTPTNFNNSDMLPTAGYLQRNTLKF